MKKSIRLIGFLLSLLSGNAFAGGSTGGGNVVECKDPSLGTSSVRLLDYYEADLLMAGLTLDLGKGKNELEQVEYVLDRLEKLDPVRADEYRETAKAFFANTKFVTKVTLPNINDHGQVPLETNCKIEQVAIQNLSRFPEAKKYTIRKDFWDKLSITDKAGLILHEVIYEEALAAGHKNSINTRYFNALVSSTVLEKMNARTYSERLALAGLSASTSSDWGLSPVQVQATVDELLRFDLLPYVLGSGGDDLKFKKAAGDAPAWLTVDPDGVLVGTPTKADIGKGELFLQIENTKGKAKVVTIPVIVSMHRHVDLKPAVAGRRYSATLESPFYGYACKPLTARRISKPAWIQQPTDTQDLILTGIPPASEAGKQASITVAFRCHDPRVIPGGPGGGSNTVEMRVIYQLSVLATPLATSKPVSAGMYSALGRVKAGKYECFGMLVGPQVVVTPGRCTSAVDKRPPQPTALVPKVTAAGKVYDPAKGTFELGGTTYPVVFERSEEDYGDLGLGLLSTEVKGIAPATVGPKVDDGDDLVVIQHSAEAKGFVSFDAVVNGYGGRYFSVTERTGGVFILPKNVGAPIFNLDNEVVALLDGSYRVKNGATESDGTEAGVLDFAEFNSLKVFHAFSKAHKVDICGITRSCAK